MSSESGDPQSTLLLLRAVRDGDAAARDDLFERYYPRVARMVAIYLGRTLRSFLDEEEVLHEAFLRAIQSLDKFEERDGATFEAWIARIVRNTIADADRARRRLKRGGGRVLREADLATRAGSVSALARDNQTPSLLSYAREIEERYDETLVTLSPRYREVLGLRDTLGYSYAQIAAAMDLGVESTARSLYTRAKKELAAKMDAS